MVTAAQRSAAETFLAEVRVRAGAAVERSAISWKHREDPTREHPMLGTVIFTDLWGSEHLAQAYITADGAARHRFGTPQWDWTPDPTRM